MKTSEKCIKIKYYLYRIYIKTTITSSNHELFTIFIMYRYTLYNNTCATKICFPRIRTTYIMFLRTSHTLDAKCKCTETPTSNLQYTYRYEFIIGCKVFAAVWRRRNHNAADTHTPHGRLLDRSGPPTRTSPRVLSQTRTHA